MKYRRWCARSGFNDMSRIWLIVSLIVLGCEDNNEHAEATASMSDVSVEQPDIFLVNQVDAALDAEVPALDMSAQAVALDVVLNSPSEGMRVALGEPLSITGNVITSDVSTLPFIAVSLVLNDVESLPLELNDEGQFETGITPLQLGDNQIVLTARRFPDVEVETVVRFNVVNCAYTEDFNETFDPEAWTIYECTRAPNDRNGPCLENVDTLLQRNGWLELTNNQLFTDSAMVLTGFGVAPNNLDLEFDVSTGKCEAPGDCDRQRIHAGGGLAVSIWNVGPEEFERVWSNRLQHFLLHPEKLRASGYERPESIHIEFDTYSNSCGPRCGQDGYDGCVNPFTDPSSSNHIQLQFNGHPEGYRTYAFEENADVLNYCGESLDEAERDDAWVDYPNLDDNRWHRIRVKILGDRLRVWAVDGDEMLNEETPLIDEIVPGFVFKGGLLSISAGSGVNGNFHRLDNLTIKGNCQ